VTEHTKSSLAGKHIVITRPVDLSQPIADVLRSHGATPILLPVVHIEPPHDYHQLDDALRDLQQEKFDWLIFGSQNAVTAVLDRAKTLGLDLRDAIHSVRVAAVGKVTAAVAQKAGFYVTRIGKGTGADLISELAPEMHAKHVFLPRSDRAGAAHFAQLHQAGAHVREVVAYRTVPSEKLDPRSIAATEEADAILFFSPSAVHAFVELVKSGILSPVRESTGIGAIGPVTQENLLKEARMRCDFQAQEPAIDQVVAALSEFFEKGRVSSAGAPAR
jgi:uroporphyrinogen III methyltransferase/synthase